MRNVKVLLNYLVHKLLTSYHYSGYQGTYIFVLTPEKVKTDV